MSKLYITVIILAIILTADCGPLTYVLCVTACNAGVVACYAAAGFVFGTVTAGAGTPAAILACNAAQSACMIACGATGVAPIP